MNENTWVISPNWVAWVLLAIASISLLGLVIYFWSRPNQRHNHIGVISWIAVVLSVVSFICVFTRSSQIDDCANLIAVLGIIVTLLVGWQIYKSIEYNQLIHRMDDMEHVAEGYMQFAVGMTRFSDHPDDTLLHCVIALEHLNVATHAKYETIFDVLDVLSESPYDSFTKSDKHRLLSALRKTNEPYAEDLAEKFKNWPTKE